MQDSNIICVLLLKLIRRQIQNWLLFTVQTGNYALFWVDDSDFFQLNKLLSLLVTSDLIGNCDSSSRVSSWQYTTPCTSDWVSDMSEGSFASQLLTSITAKADLTSLAYNSKLSINIIFIIHNTLQN